VKLVADHRAEEGRATADQPDQAEEAPRRPLPDQRRGDAEALGGVVQPEADDQHVEQAGRVAGGRLADGQALGEVVQADADGDEHGDAVGRGERLAASAGTACRRR